MRLGNLSLRPGQNRFFRSALAGLAVFLATTTVFAEDTAETDPLPKAASIEDLTAAFRAEQAIYRYLMPPDPHFTLAQPCGLLLFDWKVFPEAFNDGLIGELENDCPVYRILVLTTG